MPHLNIHWPSMDCSISTTPDSMEHRRYLVDDRSPREVAAKNAQPLSINTAQAIQCTPFIVHSVLVVLLGVAWSADDPGLLQLAFARSLVVPVLGHCSWSSAPTRMESRIRHLYLPCIYCTGSHLSLLISWMSQPVLVLTAGVTPRSRWPSQRKVSLQLTCCKAKEQNSVLTESFGSRKLAGPPMHSTLLTRTNEQ